MPIVRSTYSLPSTSQIFAPAAIRFTPMNDHRERVHTVTVDEHIELLEVGGSIADKVVVQGSIATTD